jgi:hypothetical protein
MDHDQIFHADVKKIERFSYRFSTSIHEGHRLGEDDLL